MSTPVFFSAFGLLLGTVLLIFAMRYASILLTARARAAAEGAYQALAEKAVAVQAQNEAALASIRAELAAISASLASVEKILKQVG
jgi:hypothetical protein